MTVALRWLKRPSPYADESLTGFLNRWARLNLLGTRLQLLNALGTSRAIRITPPNIKKMAGALGFDEAILQSISPSDAPAYPALRRSLTRARDEAVCPDCLREASYSRQLWSHGLATACPTHRVRLLDRCTKCSTGFAHDRPLTHFCGCGADLSLQKAHSATVQEIELAQMLMGVKPENAQLLFVLDAGVPENLDLFILGIANHFGHYSDAVGKTKAGKTSAPTSVEQTLSHLACAFELMNDWPRNFDAALHKLVRRQPSIKSTGVAQRLGTWYAFLFRKFPGAAFELFRVAAANRITQSMDGVLNARTRSVQTISA